MKITDIKVQNILGIRHADVPVAHPVVLFAAPNGNGKSSLREAVSMALDHELMRRESATKRDLSALVHDGAKNGSVELHVAGREHALFAVLPQGKTPDEGEYAPSQAMRFVTQPETFAAIPDNDRRAFLFGLTGCRIRPAEVTELLTERGVDKPRARRVMPLLRAGFADAAEEAKAQAAESRGAWKVATGEAYGDVKGGKWVAKKPEGDVPTAEALQELRDMVAATSQAQRDADAELSMLNALVGQAERRALRIAELETLAGQVDRFAAKVAADEGMREEARATLASATEAATGEPQRDGLVHDLARGLTAVLAACKVPTDLHSAAGHALAAYVAEHGALPDVSAEPVVGAIQRLPALREAFALMERSVTNAREHYRRATDAAAELRALRSATEGEADAADRVPAARARVAELAGSKAKSERDLAAADALVNQAANANRLTQTAATHHAEVQAWSRIAELLAPSGIPAELLAKGMAPFNERLAQASQDTGWPQVVVHQDMRITYGMRPYRLICESEKWRCDAMLAEAVSYVSGLRLILLDRFDVLDLSGRSELIGWLEVLASNEEVETALIFGTLKAIPTGLPPTIQTEWINAGTVGIVNTELASA